MGGISADVSSTSAAKVPGLKLDAYRTVTADVIGLQQR
jgi:hypothetical protein